MTMTKASREKLTPALRRMLEKACEESGTHAIGAYRRSAIRLVDLGLAEWGDGVQILATEAGRIANREASR